MDMNIRPRFVAYEGSLIAADSLVGFAQLDASSCL